MEVDQKKLLTAALPCSTPFLKIPRPHACRIGQPALSEDPSPDYLRETASGAALAVFFATAVTRG
jgi:hypothetical protein